MKTRPILFSAPMVRAILAGKKTQTRRLVLKSGRDADYDFMFIDPVRNRAIFKANRPAKKGELLMPSFGVNCHYGTVGDQLFVKETWRVHRDYNALSPTKVNIAMGGDTYGCVNYVATPNEGDFWGKTRVSIHMPRWASRIGLEIEDVRVERLQDISEPDAIAEGSHQKIWITSPFSAGAMNARSERGTHREGYKDIWEAINGDGSWALNPWVWKITFRRITR